MKTSLENEPASERISEFISINSSDFGSHKPDKTLKTNPFTTYRDPQTGRWIVVKPTAA